MRLTIAGIRSNVESSVFENSEPPIFTVLLAPLGGQSFELVHFSFFLAFHFLLPELVQVVLSY